jgi:hypothetical protein
MKSMSIRLPDELMNWLEIQANLNYTTKNKHIQRLLEQVKRDSDKPRYILNHSGMCHNGTHNFRALEPDISEFCNCGMFVLGELRQ